jgi:hypothetical protein
VRTSKVRAAVRRCRVDIDQLEAKTFARYAVDGLQAVEESIPLVASYDDDRDERELGGFHRVSPICSDARSGTGS